MYGFPDGFYPVFFFFFFFFFFALISIFKELTTDVKRSVFVQRSVLNVLEMLLLPYDLGLVNFVRFPNKIEHNRTKSNRIE